MLMEDNSAGFGGLDGCDRTYQGTCGMARMTRSRKGDRPVAIEKAGGTIPRETTDLRAVSGERMDRDELIRIYHMMLSIRRFEDRAGFAFTQGKIGGYLHLYIGQEAVAVGFLSAARPDDYAVAGYRDHAHYLALGGDAKAGMAELFG